MISHLISKKPENTPDFNGKNLLIAVNGVDSSALAGNNTHLKSGDVVKCQIDKLGSIENIFKDE